MAQSTDVSKSIPIDIVTPEEDEAWSLFLRKYEDLKLPPVQIQKTDVEEEIYNDGLFGKSVRSL